MNANTLLALLLALQNLELSSDLKQELKKFSDKLYYNPNNIDENIANLNTILDANSDLNQAYHAAEMLLKQHVKLLLNKDCVNLV